MGPKLVAKESRYVGEEYFKIGFHEVFAKTQLKSNRIANIFNGRVRKRLEIIRPEGKFGHQVWEISFLPCSVYTFFKDGCREKREVLVEKMLEPSNRYTKFNGNNGYVHSVHSYTASTAAEPARPALVGERMHAIAEEDEEDESIDDDSSTRSVEGHGQDTAARVEGVEAKVNDFHQATRLSRAKQTAGDASTAERLYFSPKAECYVQAFSHFSYRYSRRKMLVCDLQGVLSNYPNDNDRAGIFELTDPVIHYRSESGRSQVYGRTDLGKRGIQAFFSTHQCNDVCRLLGLSRKLDHLDK